MAINKAKEKRKIDKLYNTRGIHGHCGYLSPEQYEKVHKKKQFAV